MQIFDENSEEKIHQWLDQRKQPAEIPVERQGLYAEYTDLEERLRRRKIPEFAPDLAARIQKKHNERLHHLRAWRWAALFLIVLSPIALLTYSHYQQVAPQKETEILFDADFMEDSLEWVQDAMTSQWTDLAHVIDWNVWQKPKIQENIFKEQMDATYEKINYFFEHYTHPGFDNYDGRQG